MCQFRGYILDLGNGTDDDVYFCSDGKTRHAVCTVDELWKHTLLPFRGKYFTCHDLVKMALAFLLYHQECLNRALLHPNWVVREALKEGLIAQVVDEMRKHNAVDRILESTTEQSARELVEMEAKAQGPSKNARKKAKKKEKARQATAKYQVAAAQWATLAKKLRFAQAKVPAKRTPLEQAKADAEEWARLKQKMRWMPLVVKLRRAEVEAAPSMEMRHAQAAAAARKAIDEQRDHWEERGKLVTARMAVAKFDKYLEELLPSDEWHKAHNDREGPWNKMRKVVWKEHSVRDEAAAAAEAAKAEAWVQRKLEHAERERERAEEAERKAKEAEAEAEKLWKEEQAKGGWEDERTYNRRSRGARQREKRRQEKWNASSTEEEETKFALEMAQALQLSTEEAARSAQDKAHASDVHRAQAERLEALAKANVKKAVPPPPSPPKEEEADDDECLICWNGKATHVTVPCGHQAYCANCVPKDLGNCPMCREPMTHVIKFFKRGA